MDKLYSYDDDSSLTDYSSLFDSDIETIPSDPDDDLYVEPIPRRRSGTKSKTKKKSTTSSSQVIHID